MASRGLADAGGMESDDDHANSDSRNAAAAAAVAHRRSVTAAAIAGSIQGSPSASRARPPGSPAGMSTMSSPPGQKAWQAPPIYVADSPPKQKPWQTPQSSSAGAAVMIPPTQRPWQNPQASSAGAAATIPKPRGPKAQGSPGSTAVLAAAARSNAAAVEVLAKMASVRDTKPPHPVSNEDGEQGKSPCPVSSEVSKPSAKAMSKAIAQAKIGATLPVSEHTAAAASNAAASSAKPQAAACAPRKPATFAGRYPPLQPDRRVGWDNMVRDYGEQKEEDKKNGMKRQMTQEKWYSLHAAHYGVPTRKKPAVMMRPSAHLVSPPVSRPGISENGGHDVEEDAEEEEPVVGDEEEEPDGEEAFGEDGAPSLDLPAIF